jgi:hypothetical protein
VQLAVFGVEHWQVLPFAGGLFDQPETLLWDMIRYINIRNGVEDSDAIFAPPDAYEDQPESDVRKITL